MTRNLTIPIITRPPPQTTPQTPLIFPTALIAQAEPPHANSRPTKPHLSVSQLSMYLRCSMQYYFRYILGLRERPKVSLSLGKGGHAALEWNTKAKIATGTDRPTEEVVQKASDFMDFYLSELPPSEYEKDIEPGHLKDKHLAATRIYRLRDAPTVQPIGAEVEYTLDITHYLPDHMRPETPTRPVNMKIDLLYADQTTHVQDHAQGIAVGIEDYKYVTRKRSQTEVNISPQLTTYALALHHLTGKLPTKVGIRMMHPGSLAKNPRANADTPDSIPLLREPEHMTPDALQRRMTRIAYQFAAVEQAIAADPWIPTDDPITCSWCGFRDRCQASLVDDFEAQKLRNQK